VSRGGVYAIERDFGSESTGDSRAAIIAIAVATSAVRSATAVVAVSTISTVAAAIVVFLRFAGCRIGRWNWSGIVYDWSGCVDIEGIVIAKFAGGVLAGGNRLGLGAGSLRKSLSLTGSTTTATATPATPATSAVGSRCAFADLGLVSALGWGTGKNGTLEAGLLGAGSDRGGKVGAGLALSVAAAVATATTATVSASATIVPVTTIRRRGGGFGALFGVFGEAGAAFEDGRAIALTTAFAA
jgi:hypothetical protein